MEVKENEKFVLVFLCVKNYYILSVTIIRQGDLRSILDSEILKPNAFIRDLSEEFYNFTFKLFAVVACFHLNHKLGLF